MLDQIQSHLEAIYGIRCDYRASAFLVDAEQARRLGSAVRAREELLVAESGEGLELALYLDPALLARVSAFGEGPSGALDTELNDFCEVAEGVSHFLYLAHTAGQSRTVSLLELEAQAEVDKFAMCTLLRWRHGAARFAQSLVGRLFDRVSFHAHLSGPERWRYQEANRLAKGFCERLLPDVTAGRMDRLLSQLRHAYRLGAQAKLAHLAAH